MLVAMTVAGSDSVGGAGVEADLKAFASQGVHGAVALTAVTAQNTQRVAGIFPLTPRQVIAQIDAVLEDVHVSAVKTGMLYSSSVTAAVARRLRGEGIPLVVDPVMVAGVGDSLKRGDLVEAMVKQLIPQTTILTPNIPEAESLLGHPISDEEQARQACRELSKMGCEAVMLKGGHLEGPTARDFVYHSGKFLVLDYPRVNIRGHGGGCVLSSYLAANLAKGMGVWEAVVTAKGEVHRAVVGNYPVGKGVPVVNPLGSTVMDAQRYRVSTRLLNAARTLVDMLPRSWVPEVGTNFAFALPGATNLEDICALEGRIIGLRDRAVLTSGVGFGTSHHVASVVLAAMRHDGSMRSALNLRFSEDHLQAVEKAGLTLGSFDRRDEPEGATRTMEWGTEHAIEALGSVPDAVYDRGGAGKEPMIRLLARTPEEALSKLREVIG